MAYLRETPFSLQLKDMAFLVDLYKDVVRFQDISVLKCWKSVLYLKKKPCKSMNITYCMCRKGLHWHVDKDSQKLKDLNHSSIQKVWVLQYIQFFHSCVWYRHFVLYIRCEFEQMYCRNALKEINIFLMIKYIEISTNFFYLTWVNEVFLLCFKASLELSLDSTWRDQSMKKMWDTGLCLNMMSKT